MKRMEMSFVLASLESIAFIRSITSNFYNETGRKLSISFNGSKGYLSNITISCECQNTDDCVIWVEKISLRGNLSKILVNLHYTPEYGVNITTEVVKPNSKLLNNTLLVSKIFEKTKRYTVEVEKY